MQPASKFLLSAAHQVRSIYNTMKGYCILLLFGFLLVNVSCEKESSADKVVEILQARIEVLESENTEFKEKFKRQARRLKRIEEDLVKYEQESRNGGGISCLPPKLSDEVYFSPVRPVGLYPAGYHARLYCKNDKSALIGESNIECLEEGLWVGENARCIENYCEINATLLNEGISIQGYELSELATIQFSVSESSRIVCSESRHPYVTSREYQEPVITCMKDKIWSTDPSAFECRMIPELIPEGSGYIGSGEEEVTDDDTPPHKFIDLMFLLDGSASVGFDNFEIVKDWVKSITRKFEISEYTMIGVMQYSHFYYGYDIDDQPFLATEIPLDRYANRSEFEAQIDNILYQGYTTYTAHAIEKAARNIKASKRFNDSSTTKYLLLLTDGSSTDYDRLEETTQYARSGGIIIYAVGVGEYSEEEFEVISNGEGRIYDVTNFEELYTIVDMLVESIISEAKDKVIEDDEEKGLAGCFLNGTDLYPDVEVVDYYLEELENTAFKYLTSLQLYCSNETRPYRIGNEYVAPYITCQKDGIWSADPTEFECDIVCYKPEDVQNGYWNDPNLREFYEIGSTLWFSCDEGYTAVSKLSIVACIPGGRWSASGELCEIIEK